MTHSGEQFRPRIARVVREPRAALLPLRFAFGATFLYAGLDKLLDPAFLQPSGRGSIAEQLAGYTHGSPIGGLVTLLALPFPVLVGAAIAIAEIGVGLGTLLGVAFRLATFGGMVLSTLFFLTASWSVRPFYLGNDLPYALGWATLMLAGHGGILALGDPLARRVEMRLPSLATVPLRRRGGLPDPAGARGLALDRRSLVQAAILAVLAFLVAGIAAALEAAVGRRVASGAPAPSPAAATPAPIPSASGSPRSTASAAPSASASASASPAASITAAPSGTVIGKTSQVAAGRGLTFDDPTSGDPGVVLRLADGRFVAFDRICPHAGCTVDFDPSSGLLVCPCHQARFDPARDAAAVSGPTFTPLTPFTISVDASGTIRLTG